MFLEVPFLAFFSLTHEEKEVWPYRYADGIPLVALIIYIYGFVGLTSTVLS